MTLPPDPNAVVSRPTTVDGKLISERTTYWDIHGEAYSVDLVEENDMAERGWVVCAGGSRCCWWNLYADKAAARVACANQGWEFKE